MTGICAEALACICTATIFEPAVREAWLRALPQIASRNALVSLPATSLTRFAFGGQAFRPKTRHGMIFIL